MSDIATDQPINDDTTLAVVTTPEDPQATYDEERQLFVQAVLNVVDTQIDRANDIEMLDVENTIEMIRDTATGILDLLDGTGNGDDGYIVIPRALGAADGPDISGGLRGLFDEINT